MSNHRVTSASGVFDHELPRDNLMFRWTRGSPGSNIYQMGKFTVDPSPAGGKNQRSLSGSPWWQKFNSTSTCSIWGALGKYRTPLKTVLLQLPLTTTRTKTSLWKKFRQKAFHMLSNRSPSNWSHPESRDNNSNLYFVYIYLKPVSKLGSIGLLHSATSRLSPKLT